MFNPEELNNLLVFMNQVQLQGNQSIAHAVLVQKIQNSLKEAQALQEKAPAVKDVEVKEKT